MGHTPEPWLVSSSTLVCTTDARVVAQCAPLPIEELGLPLKEARANAHLIAASPLAPHRCEDPMCSGNRLLALLTRLASYSVNVHPLDWRNVSDEARALLAKIEGEG